MANVRITSAAKALLRAAARSEIEAYFAGLTPAARQQRWIRAGNRYRISCIKTYEDDLRNNTVNDSDLIAYVAGSGPTHVIDAWSSLSRAVEAALRGDNYSAVHFAYYAELRAAVALLACEGIGIFSRHHPIVQKTGRTSPGIKVQKRNRTTGQFGGSEPAATHLAVWLALKHWASLKSASELLDELIFPAGVSVSDWATACGRKVPSRAIAQTWLTTWGLDLSVLDDDHNSRNLASYRPFEFRRSPPLDAVEVVEFVEELWRAFEPSIGSRFQTLERLLLRRTLRKLGAANPTQAQIETLGIDSALAAQWEAFLANHDDPKLFDLAEQPGSVDDPRCHLQIISRAALLLYVATGAARRLLTEATYDRNTIQFWWRQHGQRRGLWDDAQSPADPLELWADIEPSLDAAHAWRNSPGAATASIRTWRRTHAAVLDDFGGIELAGIWGLIP
ncbi:MAG TPA: hypothetical protein VGB82_28025 [Alphaproteobacteria bacterium]